MQPHYYLFFPPSFTMQEAVKSVDTGQWPAEKEYVP